LLLWVKEGEEEGVRGRFLTRLSIEGEVVVVVEVWGVWSKMIGKRVQSLMWRSGREEGARVCAAG
jgi:hypothetical protein